MHVKGMPKQHTSQVKYCCSSLWLLPTGYATQIIYRYVYKHNIFEGSTSPMQGAHIGIFSSLTHTQQPRMNSCSEFHQHIHLYCIIMLCNSSQIYKRRRVPSSVRILLVLLDTNSYVNYTIIPSRVCCDDCYLWIVSILLAALVYMAGCTLQSDSYRYSNSACYQTDPTSTKCPAASERSETCVCQHPDEVIDLTPLAFNNGTAR